MYTEIEEIKHEFARIIKEERKLLHFPEVYMPMANEEIYRTSCQLLEIASSALVLRSYNSCYHMTDDNIAYESVSSHTNLGLALIDRALMYLYGPDLNRTCDGFSYREIMEAFRRHDLPENLIGDIPDDGNRNDVELAIAECEYWRSFSGYSPRREAESERNIAKLLQDMSARSTPTGRLMYLSDKISALIITLCYDYYGESPMMSRGDDKVSQKDLMAMSLCDYNEDGMFKASEMWMCDYLKLREIVQYDEYGFLTSIAVMTTLIVKGKWYSWRENDYK